MALVLVVDDDSLWVEANARVLRRAGHEVFGLTDPQLALEQALARFELVVTDFDMPRLTGVELARQVRQRLRALAPPMVLVSAFSETRADVHPFFDAVLGKPYVPGVLMEAVERLLERRVRAALPARVVPSVGGSRLAVRVSNTGTGE